MNATPGTFYTGKETRYPLNKRLGGPHGRSERHGKSRPNRDSIPGLSSPYQVAIPTTLSRATLTTISFSKHISDLLLLFPFIRRVRLLAESAYYLRQECPTVCRSVHIHQLGSHKISSSQPFFTCVPLGSLFP